MHKKCSWFAPLLLLTLLVLPIAHSPAAYAEEKTAAQACEEVVAAVRVALRNANFSAEANSWGVGCPAHIAEAHAELLQELPKFAITIARTLRAIHASDADALAEQWLDQRKDSLEGLDHAAIKQQLVHGFQRQKDRAGKISALILNEFVVCDSDSLSVTPFALQERDKKLAIDDEVTAGTFVLHVDAIKLAPTLFGISVGGFGGYVASDTLHLMQIWSSPRAKGAFEEHLRSALMSTEAEKQAAIEAQKRAQQGLLEKTVSGNR